jgi:lipoprotein-anchoring transpeptidase ErfK/SrfK
VLLRIRTRPTIGVLAAMARWRPVVWLAACALGLTPAMAAGQASAPAPPSTVVAPDAKDALAGLKNPGDTVFLSDERTVTRWAHAQQTAKIRGEPRPDARAVARLRFLTEDGAAEVYIVLDGRIDSARRRWLHIRVPTRGNRRTGWVLADALSRLYVVRTQLVIDRSALRAKLYRRGDLVWSAPVGIGKSDTPTPRGSFWIRELLKGLGDGDTYGPWAFGTSAYSNVSDWPGGGVVGIHGTNAPGLVPGRPSHGCVRVRNDKIRQLARLMPVGTPVQVIR